ncbi:MAG: ABC transporter substrate-binding protein [Bacteroidota bacterium]
MSWKILLIPFLVLSLHIGVQGQDVNYQQQYLNAKALFKEGKYALAREAFKPVIQVDENNLFSQYASYYFALSSYHDGDKATAKNMLLQIRQLNSDWKNIDELQFWLGHIYFETKDYELAVGALNVIKRKQLKSDAEALKYSHFKKEELDKLSELYEQYPEEKELAKALAGRIESLPLSEQDHDFLLSLIDKFGLERTEFHIGKMAQSEFKDEYKVAVILPFIYDRLEYSEGDQVNQFVLDLYQGIQLALDTLESQGINIELFAYDNKRDSAKTALILSKPEMKAMDLIIGPIFSKPRRLVNDFAYSHKINVMHPLRTDTESIGNNPFSLLYSPCDEQVAEAAAAYAINNAKNKNAIIFYGQSRKDSVSANAYKALIEEEGFNIVLFQEVAKDSSKFIFDVLTATEEKTRRTSLRSSDAPFKIAKDSIGSIYVASDEGLISADVVSAIDTRNDSVLVIGSESWLDFKFIDYSSYERLGITLTAPTYVVTGTDAYLLFREKFTEAFGRVPSGYAVKGYEIMNFTGRSLLEYGTYFQNGLHNAGYKPGVLTPGFNYQDSNSNLVVPIIKFVEGELVVVNNFKDTVSNDDIQK